MDVDDGFTEVRSRSKRNRRNRKKKIADENIESQDATPWENDSSANAAEPIHSKKSPVGKENGPTSTVASTLPDTSPQTTSPSQPKQNHVMPSSESRSANTKPQADEDGWVVKTSKKAKRNADRRAKRKGNVDEPNGNGPVAAVDAPTTGHGPNGVAASPLPDPTTNDNPPKTKQTRKSKKKKKLSSRKANGLVKEEDLVSRLISLIKEHDPSGHKLSIVNLGNFFQEEMKTSWNKTYKESYGPMSSFILNHKDDFVLLGEVVWLKAHAPSPPKSAPPKTKPKAPPTQNSTSRAKKRKAKKDRPKGSNQKKQSSGNRRLEEKAITPIESGTLGAACAILLLIFGVLIHQNFWNSANLQET